METGLYEQAWHYDLLMPGPNDLPFYQRQVKRYGEPVLELACGTGRLTIPLRLAGFDITGLDSAPAMLQAARTKAQRRDVEIKFVEADCRDFSFDRRFRLIFIANNSLSHLLRRKDVEDCFRSVRQHLEPDGRFIVDIFTPSVHFLARDKTQQYPVGEYTDPDGGGRITVTGKNEYDPATQVSDITWHYQREGEPGDTWDVPLKLRMFYPQEIDALLTCNGFAIEHKYGDFEDAPYGSQSLKQVIVCR